MQEGIGLDSKIMVVPEEKTESPPLSPTDPSVFAATTYPFSAFCTLSRPFPHVHVDVDVDDDDDVDVDVDVGQKPSSFPLCELYPNDEGEGMYTPEALIGFAAQAIQNYNQHQKTAYTFKKLEKVLSCADLWYDRTFNITFTAADSDGVVEQRFKALVATEYPDETEENKIYGSDSDSAFYYAPDIDKRTIIVLKVVVVPASPPQ